MHQAQRLVARATGIWIGALCLVPTVFAENWDFYTYMPAPNTPERRIAVMLEDIGKETGGKLTIRLHMGGSLQINTTNITPAVADNVVQMGDDSQYTGSVPIGGVLRLPSLIRSYEEFAKAAVVLDPYLDAAYQKKGVIVLGRYHYPPAVLWSNKKLTSLADLKGQKIRLITPEQAEFLKRFGATGVTIGTAEVAPALERGVVDGVVTASSGGGVLWKDVLKYNYRFPLNYSDSLILVNADAFGKLPPDIQSKVRKIVADGLASVTEIMRDEEESLTKKFAAEGMIVTVPRPEEINEVGAQFPPYWESWARARGAETTDALAKVRRTLGR
jgi:TRAP-type C4-dicarboxylate transport system substrate-binding protein